MARIPVRTPDIVQEWLKVQHDTYGLSWRRIANLDDYSGIPAGTLSSIAHGYPVPKKWMKRLGMQEYQPAPVCAKCGVVHVTKRCTAAPRKPREKSWAREPGWCRVCRKVTPHNWSVRLGLHCRKCRMK